MGQHTTTKRMRRDYFTLQVRDIDWLEEDTEPQLPRLRILYEGPIEPFLDGFTRDEALVPPEEVDVAFRLQGPMDDPDATGVLSLTDRYTGEFLLELNATVDTMVGFLRAARRYGETVADSSGRFEVDIQADDDKRISYEKRTLLVYYEDGSLARKHSLIPSGVEL